MGIMRCLWVRIRGFLNAPWSKLKGLRQPKWGRAALLIPIFGYLILFNENVVKYLNLIGTLISKSPYDFGVSPRYFLIYFGLCFVSLAVALYSSFCPSVVTHYGNPSAFAQGDGPGLSDIQFETIERDLQASGRYAGVARIRERYERVPGGGVRLPTPEEAWEINKAVMHAQYEALEYSSPLARISSRILFLLGGAFLGLPSLQMFLKISRLLLLAGWSEIHTWYIWCCQ